MPINPSALSPPQPDPDEAAAREQGPPTTGDAEAQPRRKRRNKAEMIAAAVVPGADDAVEIKDVGTGAKIERPWRVAVEMVRGGKAEWSSSDQKYAFLKYEQQRTQGAFAQEPQTDEAAQPDLGQHSGKTADSYAVPEDAELGDEVVVGGDVYVVGHGRVLVQGMVAVDGEIVSPKQRWQRELGAGPDGPWQATPLGKSSIDHPAPQQTNGAGSGEAVRVDTGHLPMDVERVGLAEWKVGTGILEKIGLPDYSSLQVGPITASRMVMDDGRRTTVTIGDRQASIPTAVVEIFQEVTDVCEYVARYQRGQLASFLESTGALKQPVS